MPSPATSFSALYLLLICAPSSHSPGRRHSARFLPASPSPNCTGSIKRIRPCPTPRRFIYTNRLTSNVQFSASPRLPIPISSSGWHSEIPLGDPHN
ncbi:hypothetical protein C8R47DRAFT_1150577 [Mycena vitilis]|nr:hypothetical protein C8R47DRAFT_1150577 [Mycena vitilis]